MSDPRAVVAVAEVTRSGVVESVHDGVVVALRGIDSIAWRAGDPILPQYPRSALKPLQAQAMLNAGLVVDQRQLAIACASHSGEAEHLAVVRGLLASVGLDESALDNTPDWPLGADAARELVRAGGAPERIYQNCSGKHAAMLATCVANGWPLDDYLDVDHPLQSWIAAHITAVTGPADHVGIDGCGAPTAYVSLLGVAQAYQALATADHRVARAMRTHPELVGGPGRDVTELMRAVPGLVAKEGAEGVYVAAMPDGRAVALKIADGGERARLPVMLAALRSLEIDVSAVTPAADPRPRSSRSARSSPRRRVNRSVSPRRRGGRSVAGGVRGRTARPRRSRPARSSPASAAPTRRAPRRARRAAGRTPDAS